MARAHDRLPTKRVLVVGGDGREHALVRSLLRSPQLPDVLAAPGNAGIAKDRVPCLPLRADDVEAIVRAAREERCDLVVVGPEAPLVGGLVDALADAGISAFGPSGGAARIEGSKAYAKELMQAVGVPTGGYAVVHSREQAVAALAAARAARLRLEPRALRRRGHLRPLRARHTRCGRPHRPLPVTLRQPSDNRRFVGPDLDRLKHFCKPVMRSDSASRSQSFETTGARAYLYFTRHNYRRCEQTLDRDLVRVPVTISK